MKILIVEDDLLVQRVFIRATQRACPDAEINTATSYPIAVTHLSSVNYDLVISDYDLEIGTGEQVLEWVRASSQTVKFLFISANERIAVLGVPYLAKPAPPADIIEAIKNTLK